MARLHQIFFQQHLLVAEGIGGLALCTGQCGGEVLRAVHAAHPLATATSHGLDQHRIADASGFFGQQLGRLVIPVITRHDRNLRLFHQRLGGTFRPIASMAEAGGPMKTSPASLQALAKPAFSDRKP